MLNNTKSKIMPDFTYSLIARDSLEKIDISNSQNKTIESFIVDF
jgi:hypothetical protein